MLITVLDAVPRLIVSCSIRERSIIVAMRW